MWGGAKALMYCIYIYIYIYVQVQWKSTSTQNPGETPKRRETVTTLHVRLDFTVSKSPPVPFNSTICPRNGPKRRQKAPKTAQCAPTPRIQARAVSWATWLKIRSRGHLVHPQPPTFCGFQASEWPNETPRPPYQWSLGGAGGQHSPRTVGANLGNHKKWGVAGGLSALGIGF